jgi:GNAT superfamily N-acetyltransferase
MTERTFRRKGFDFTVRRTEAGVVSVIATKDGKNVGIAHADLIDYKGSDGRKKMQVSSINVNPEYQKQKLGTTLYETLLQEACADGRSLYSDETRSVFSEAFWRKQQTKGRAVCAIDNSHTQASNYLTSPLWSAMERIEDECAKDSGDDTAELHKSCPVIPNPIHKISQKRNQYVGQWLEKIVEENRSGLRKCLTQGRNRLTHFIEKRVRALRKQIPECHSLSHCKGRKLC